MRKSIAHSNKNNEGPKATNKSTPKASLVRSPNSSGRSQNFSSSTIQSAATLLPLVGLVSCKRTLPTNSTSRALIIGAAVVALCFIKCFVLNNTAVPVHALVGPAYLLLTYISDADDFGVTQTIFMVEQLMVAMVLLLVLAFLGPNTLLFLSTSALLFSSWFWYRRGSSIRYVPKNEPLGEGTANKNTSQPPVENEGIATGNLPQPSNNFDLAIEVVLLLIASITAMNTGWPSSTAGSVIVSNSFYSNPWTWIVAVIYTASMCIVFLLRENQALLSLRVPAVSYTMHALHFASILRQSSTSLNISWTVLCSFAQLTVPLFLLMSFVFFDEREGIPITGCVMLLVATFGCGLMQRFPPYASELTPIPPPITRIDAGQIASVFSTSARSAPRIPPIGYVLYFMVFGVLLAVGGIINPPMRSIFLYHSISVAVIFTDIYARRLQAPPIALQNPIGLVVVFALTYIVSVYYILLQKELFSPDSVFGPVVQKYQNAPLQHAAGLTTSSSTLSSLDNLWTFDEGIGKSVLAVATMLYACFLTQGILFYTYANVKRILTQLSESSSNAQTASMTHSETGSLSLPPSATNQTKTEQTDLSIARSHAPSKKPTRKTPSKIVNSHVPPATVAPIASTPLESIDGDSGKSFKANSDVHTPSDEAHALSPTPTNDSIITSSNEPFSKEHNTEWLRLEQQRADRQRVDVDIHKIKESEGQSPTPQEESASTEISETPTLKSVGQSSHDKISEVQRANNPPSKTVPGKSLIIINKSKPSEKSSVTPVNLPTPPSNVLVSKKKSVPILPGGGAPGGDKVNKKMSTQVTAKPKALPASLAGIPIPGAASLAVTLPRSTATTTVTPPNVSFSSTSKAPKSVELPSLSDLVKDSTCEPVAPRPIPRRGPVCIDEDDTERSATSPPPPPKPRHIDPFVAAFAPPKALTPPRAPLPKSRPPGPVVPPSAIGADDSDGESNADEQGSSPTVLDRNWDEIITPTATSNTSSNAFAMAIGGGKGVQKILSPNSRFGFGATPITNNSVTSRNAPIDSFTGIDNGLGSCHDSSRSISHPTTANPSAVGSPTRDLETSIHRREDSDPESLGKLQHLMALINTASGGVAITEDGASPAPKKPSMVDLRRAMLSQTSKGLPLAVAGEEVEEDLTDAKFLAKLALEGSGLMRSASTIRSPQLRPPSGHSHFTVTAQAPREVPNDPSLASVNFSDFNVPTAASMTESDTAWDSLIRDLGIGDGTDGTDRPPAYGSQPHDYEHSTAHNSTSGVIPTSQTVYYLMDHTGTQRPYVLGNYNGQPTYVPVAYQ